ncbi:transposase [Flavobacteriales bacterium]|nr:transposase [Flavobacteriales bacterium]
MKIKIRLGKYLNNEVEQDHRSIKRRIIVTFGFKEFESVQSTSSGIEVVNVIRKNQIVDVRACRFQH